MPDIVEQYARDVVSGAEVAGPLVRQAGKRHLDDLVNGPSRGLKWDWETAKNKLQFFPSVLRLAGGEHEGRAFDLHVSQAFIVGNIFGWKTVNDDARRFRMAYVEEGKGNGKSPLAAGIAANMFVADNEQRAEVYFAAVDKDQAKVPFRDLVAMVDQSPVLDAAILRQGTPGREWRLQYPATNSFCQPIASESGGRGKSGPRPSCAVCDEVHEHPTNAMVEFLRAGTKGRKQALILMITNSGVVDPNAVCYEYHQYAERVLSGVEQNDGIFFYVCGLDGPRIEEVNGELVEIPGDNWADPAVWKKANPLLGVSITEKYLMEQVRDALGMPSKQSIIRRLNFCEWVESASPFITGEVWDQNERPVDVESLRGRSCVGAIDLSGKNDLTSITLVFDEDEEGLCDVLAFFWTPKDTLLERSKRDKVNYQLWVEQGYIEATPGKVIDYSYVAAQIRDLMARYNIRAFAFDPARIDDLIKELDELGTYAVKEGDDGGEIVLVPHAQGYAAMHPSIEALEDGLLERKFRLGGNHVLKWCVFNVRVESNSLKLRMFSKRISTGRIDGATTLAMAAGVQKTFVDSSGDYKATLIL